MALRGFCYFFLTMLIAILAGCAGGAMVKAPVAPTQAIVKVRTSGTLPAGATIGGIQTTIIYPTTESSVVTSGSGAGAGSILMPNVNNPGQIKLILANVAPGIQSGEFTTLTFNIAAAKSPVAGDFAIASGASILDTNSTAITGMTVEIQGVTFQ